MYDLQFIWHKSNSFASLNPITQVYGVCFDKEGNILIMKSPGKNWNISGGHPEINELPIDTLKRELKEEVSVTLLKAEMIGYMEVISKTNPSIYQLRFAAIIDNILPLEKDPATNEFNERLFILPKDFFNYVKYKDYKPMIDTAIEWYNKNR